MKDNAKCFIRIGKGNYKEITYKELEEKRKKYITYRKKKFIPIQGMLIEVCPSEYKDFYKEIERGKYYKKLEKNNRVCSYNNLSDEEFNGIEVVADMNVDVEFEVERKIEIERLERALLELNQDEYTLIKKLFYEDISLRKYAEMTGKPFGTIQTRKRAVIKKLRKILKI